MLEYFSEPNPYTIYQTNFNLPYIRTMADELANIWQMSRVGQISRNEYHSLATNAISVAYQNILMLNVTNDEKSKIIQVYNILRQVTVEIFGLGYPFRHNNINRYLFDIGIEQENSWWWSDNLRY